MRYAQFAKGRPENSYPPPPPTLVRGKSALTALLLAAALLLLLLAVAPAGAQTIVDYDTDDNGLIEIDSLSKLNAIRHDLDGNGDATHADYYRRLSRPRHQHRYADGLPFGNVRGATNSPPT